MNRENILTAVGKMAAKALAAEGSPDLVDFITGDMVFEVGDYDFLATMAANIQKNSRGGNRCPSAL